MIKISTNPGESVSVYLLILRSGLQMPNSQEKAEIDKVVTEYLKLVSLEIKLDSQLSKEEKDRRIKEKKDAILSKGYSKRYKKACEGILKQFKKIDDFLVSRIFGFKGVDGTKKTDIILEMMSREKEWLTKVENINSNEKRTYNMYYTKWERGYLLNDYYDRLTYSLRILDDIVNRTFTKLEKEEKEKFKEKVETSTIARKYKNIRGLPFQTKWSFFFDNIKSLFVKDSLIVNPTTFNTKETSKTLDSIQENIKKTYNNYRNPESHGKYRAGYARFTDYETDENVASVEHVVITLLEQNHNDIVTLFKSNVASAEFAQLVEKAKEHEESEQEANRKKMRVSN